MNNQFSNISNKELIRLYKKGCKFVSEKMQFTGTEYAEDDTKYNPELFNKALRRLEQLTDELYDRYHKLTH